MVERKGEFCNLEIVLWYRALYFVLFLYASLWNLTYSGAIYRRHKDANYSEATWA